MQYFANYKIITLIYWLHNWIILHPWIIALIGLECQTLLCQKRKDRACKSWSCSDFFHYSSEFMFASLWVISKHTFLQRLLFFFFFQQHLNIYFHSSLQKWKNVIQNMNTACKHLLGFIWRYKKPICMKMTLLKLRSDGSVQGWSVILVRWGCSHIFNWKVNGDKTLHW